MEKTEKTSIVLGGFFAILVIILSIFPDITYVFFITVPILLIISVVISLIMSNKITKSENSLVSKIYFIFIFNALIFSTINFAYIGGMFFSFFVQGTTTEGFAYLFFIYLPTLIIGSIVFIIETILSIKRKERKDFEYNIKKLSLIYTILLGAVIILYSTIGGAMMLANYLTIDNPREVAYRGYDCDEYFYNSPQELSTCYFFKAYSTGEPTLCLKGIKNSIPGMNDCLINAAETSGDSSICEYFVDNITFKNYNSEDIKYINTAHQRCLKIA